MNFTIRLVAEKWGDEQAAREALYGPQTRSGSVGEAFTGSMLWMDWDSVQWFPVGFSIGRCTPENPWGDSARGMVQTALEMP